MVLAAYLHRLDPFAIEVTEGFGLRWYGLSYLAGFLAAYALMRWGSRRGLTPLRPERVGDFILAAAIGTVIGGRLGYVLFYQPSLFTDFSNQIPFWGLLAINQGGMASHGGIIGILVACLWFARKDKLPAVHLMDLTCVTGPIGVVFGRLANFVNGELYGRPCDAQSFFAVRFPQEMAQWDAAQLGDPAVIAARQVAEAAGHTGVHGLITAVQQMPEVAQRLEPLITPRYPSQLFQAGLEGLALFVLLAWIWRKPRRPGTISAAFLMGYAVMRIIGEQFRMPDAHIGYQWLGLTRGQWLSVLMFGAGIGFLLAWYRWKQEPLGGWGVSKPSARNTPSIGASNPEG